MDDKSSHDMYQGRGGGDRSCADHTSDGSAMTEPGVSLPDADAEIEDWIEGWMETAEEP